MHTHSHTPDGVDLSALFDTPQLCTTEAGLHYGNEDGLIYREVATPHGGLAFVPVVPARFYDPCTGEIRTAAELVTALDLAIATLAQFDPAQCLGLTEATARALLDDDPDLPIPRFVRLGRALNDVHMLASAALSASPAERANALRAIAARAAGGLQ